MLSAQTDSDMVECPYNKSHRMLRKRLQSHLIKCRANYPDVELQKCPFNQLHLIPEPEFVHHVTSCPDRKLITQYMYDAPQVKEEEVVKHKPVECEENWDDTEVEDYDPKKYIARANVLRRPTGTRPSERKAFVKKERKRLGDCAGDDDKTTAIFERRPKKEASYSDEDNEYRHRNTTPPPPPPFTYNWQSRMRKLDHMPSHSRSRSRSPPNRHWIGYRPVSPTQQNGYSLDEDPYYNGGSSSSYSNLEDEHSTSSSSSRLISYPDLYSRARYTGMPQTTPLPGHHLAGRGAHRGHYSGDRYTGSIRGRYDMN